MVLTFHVETKTARVTSSVRRNTVRRMAQAVRAGSVFQPSATKCTLLRQRLQVPPFRLVRACYTGDEATVHCYLQCDPLNLDYQVPQMLRTLSSMRFID
jgi:hypothetical protein